MFQLLRERGLTRFYDLRRGEGTPVGELDPESRDRKWLEPYEQQVRESTGMTRITLDVQGIHCAGCVWLMQELFRRTDGAVQVTVNPALGRAELAVQPGFALQDYVREVERFGYLLGPAVKEPEAQTDDLLLRTGICVALAGNSMLFAAALYLGLEQGPLFELMHQLNYALAAVAVMVGGSVFIRSSVQSLRRGMLHLDTPIALGIVLAFAGSSWSFFFQNAQAAYFDTVTVFIALMLLGRWLQERVLARNRRQLLAHDGADGVLARRVRQGQVELVAARELVAGDTLMIAPGDLVPVDGTVLDGRATCSLDWINGESAPRDFERGETVPAGAFNLGNSAIRLEAATGFSDSPLVELLRNSPARQDDRWGESPWWQRTVGAYVLAVLLAAAGGAATWIALTGNGVRATEVAIAVLVVTCPCAFGIATPLAYELVQAGLRRSGLFVRTAGFLDRVRSIRRIVFDKTGTLTTGALHLADPTPLDALGPDERAALYDLAARSAHPKSLAVKRALDERGQTLRPDVEVDEHPGKGLEAHIEGKTHRLGSPQWAGGEGAQACDADLVYAVDGRILAALSTRETLRPDAVQEIDGLRRAGYELWILSGDAPSRVTSMARELGLSPGRAVGGLEPSGKAAWLDARGAAETLMIGDGINDSLAVERACCSGTPSVDRPFMPARSDFYFVSPGLAPIARALRAASALHGTIRGNLAFAVLYNLIAVALAWAGIMKPWLAAVSMPLSSLVVLALTTTKLSTRSPLWRS